jgi:serine/threonine protein kinase
MPQRIGSELFALQEVLAGRYSIEHELGRGGMGIVYLARDVALDRLVAIKLLPPTFAADSGHRERFLAEARTAAGLSHPNIVPIHSVEEHGSLVFFVMGYVEGETLRERVERGIVLAKGCQCR